MKSSILRVSSSSGMNKESVSSSVGGFRNSFAILNAGNVAKTKPAPEKNTPKDKSPVTRLNCDVYLASRLFVGATYPDVS